METPDGGAGDAGSEGLATAHQEWDRRWRDPQEHAGWEAPEPLVRALPPLLRQRGLTRVLDLGCGIGRHAAFLAAAGFRCAGLDASPAGIAHARQQAAALGQDIDYRIAPFSPLPFAARSFDGVVAWNVIYHGDGAVAAGVLDEVRRVLVAGGLYTGTMLSKRNHGFGRGRQVRPDTFVVEGGAGETSDKGHPHFYCDSAGLLALHHGFEVLELRDREQRPGAYHWEFILERRG